MAVFVVNSCPDDVATEDDDDGDDDDGIYAAWRGCQGMPPPTDDDNTRRPDAPNVSSSVYSDRPVNWADNCD